MFVRTKIRTSEANTSDAELILPQNVCRQLKIPSTTLSIQFGSKVAQGKVKASSSRKETLMTPPLVQALHVPPGVPLLLRYDAVRQRIVLGPLIGILVSRYRKENPRNPFGVFTPFLNEITDVCRRNGGVACAIRLDDVNWTNETVRGLVRRKGTWHALTLPLPQCIHNRLISRAAEKSDTVNLWIQRCKEKQIPFFNERFLNKWHVHQALQEEAAALRYLPETMRYHGHQDLREMLRHHCTVYAKPTNGSMGRGIYRIRKREEGYKLTTATASGSSSKSYSDLMALHRALQKKIKGKSYLLQQGLELIGRNGKPTDFRVLVQKNRRGEWSVSSLVARLGQNKVVSNIARGGSMTSAAQALRICGPKRSAPFPTRTSLKQAALHLAQLLEQTIPGHFAEFGIDLGVDVRGRIWLLEVNSKPSKAASAVQTAEDEEEAEESTVNRGPRPSVKRMMEYAAFLGGFAPRKKGKKTKAKGKRKRNRR